MFELTPAISARGPQPKDDTILWINMAFEPLSDQDWDLVAHLFPIDHARIPTIRPPTPESSRRPKPGFVGT